MRAPAVIAVALLVLACRGPARPTPPTTGAIAGVLRDVAAGAPVPATVTVHDQRSFRVASDHAGADGAYRIGDLPVGTYDMVVELPGTSLQLTGIPVTAGHTTAFDIPVDLGAVEVAPARYSQVASDAIRTYRPAGLTGAATGQLGGTVTDTATRERVAGAVVTATAPGLEEPLTGVTDDGGRFTFDAVIPGTYTLSAFYQVARRGQIEVRRTGIDVAAETAVDVPLFIEVTGTD